MSETGESHTRALLADIEAFLDRFGPLGMTQTRLGREAAGDHTLVPRLREGAKVTYETGMKVRVWMAAARARLDANGKDA